MQYRHLGRWGVRVSAVGLGSWITYGGSVAEEAAAACIARAWELGITFFDTANIYARGEAERVVGRALKPIRRDGYVLATKLFWPMDSGPNDRGLSRKHVVEQLHHSLRRLDTEYIDLYQCHRYDERTPLDETCRAMDDVIRQGKVLYWGVSEWTAEQIENAVTLCRNSGWSEPISNQPQYSALYRVIEREVLPACVRLGMGTVVWSPLAMGVLTGKYRSVDELPPGSRAAGDAASTMGLYLRQDVLDAVQRLREVADDAGCTMAQLALAWCLRSRDVSGVIVGASRPEQLDDTAAAADLSLDAAVFDAVDRVLAGVAIAEP